VARESWKGATAQASVSIAAKDVDNAGKWSAVQDRYFKQCRNCASDLGMTITSRCKLVVPSTKEETPNPLISLLEKRRA